VRTAKQATLSSNASEQALYDSADVDLPVRKGKSPAGMQSGDSLFSGQVPGATRSTQVAGGGAANDIVDLPGKKAAGATGAVQSGDSLFSGQVPGAARPTPVENAAEVPRRKYTTQGEDNYKGWSKTPYDHSDGELPARRPASEDVPMLPGTKTSAGAPPAPGVNPAAPPPAATAASGGAGPTTGAQAARTVPADSETDAAFGQATSGKSNGPEASAAPPITRMRDPSRLIDWAVGPGIGAAIGGAYGAATGKDPLKSAMMGAAVGGTGGAMGVPGLAGTTAATGAAGAAGATQAAGITPQPALGNGAANTAAGSAMAAPASSSLMSSLTGGLQSANTWANQNPVAANIGFQTASSLLSTPEPAPISPNLMRGQQFQMEEPQYAMAQRQPISLI